jgi:hypothetical protein
LIEEFEESVIVYIVTAFGGAPLLALCFNSGGLKGSELRSEILFFW